MIRCRFPEVNEPDPPMNPAALEKLLREVRAGKLTPAKALDALRLLPFEDLGYARIDHHRALRTGAAEVVFGEGKSPAEVEGIVASLRRAGARVLVTRLGEDGAAAVRARFPEARYDARARVLTMGGGPGGGRRRGRIVIAAAGTADLPVAEEAAVTASFLAPNRVERVYDVGVAGLHRLLANARKLRSARVLVVVAGMEGALPSVVGGLVGVPLIAVPTSVGYGASFRGLAALLAMMNSCAPGVVVVNIDNGFGAGYAASLINSASHHARGGRRK